MGSPANGESVTADRAEIVFFGETARLWPFLPHGPSPKRRRLNPTLERRTDTWRLTTRPSLIWARHLQELGQVSPGSIEKTKTPKPPQASGGGGGERRPSEIPPGRLGLDSVGPHRSLVPQGLTCWVPCTVSTWEGKPPTLAPDPRPTVAPTCPPPAPSLLGACACRHPHFWVGQRLGPPTP